MKTKFTVGVAVKVVNMENGEVQLFPSISEAARCLGTNQTTVSRYVNGYRKKLYQKKFKIIEAKKEKKSSSAYVPKMSHTVLVKRIKDNKIYSFDTLTETAEFFAVVPSTIYQYCKSGKVFRGKYIFAR